MSNGRARRLGAEPLAEHDLEDVAGVDVLARLRDRGLELAAGEVRRDSGCRVPGVGASGSMSVKWQVGDAPGQLARPADRRRRRPRRMPPDPRSPIPDPPTWAWATTSDRLGDVVEDDHAVVEAEAQVGQAAVVRRRRSAAARRSGRCRSRRSRPPRRRTAAGPAGAGRGTRRSCSSSSRSGSACVGLDPRAVAVAGADRGCRDASNARNGPAPRKLYRPTRSPPTTLSKRNDQSPSWILQNADTGVRVSPMSRR